MSRRYKPSLYRPTGLIMSKITYALPSFAGQLTADDRNRIGAISRKAQRRGVSCRAVARGVLGGAEHPQLYLAEPVLK